MKLDTVEDGPRGHIKGHRRGLISCLIYQDLRTHRKPYFWKSLQLLTTRPDSNSFVPEFFRLIPGGTRVPVNLLGPDARFLR